MTKVCNNEAGNVIVDPKYLENYIREWNPPPGPFDFLKEKHPKQSGAAGVKNDSGKRQWWFLGNIIQPMQEVIDILALGDNKYPSEDGANWRRVPNAKKRYSSAALRHFVDGYLAGETHDSETGKHHLAHTITNLLFLLWFEMQDSGQTKNN